MSYTSPYKKMNWPGVSSPDPKWDSAFYNPGQTIKPGTVDSFISKFGCFLKMTKNGVKEQVMATNKMENSDVFVQVFGDAQPSDCGNLNQCSDLMSAVEGINNLLAEVMSNENNLEIWKSNGYYNCLAIFTLFDNLDPDLSNLNMTAIQDQVNSFIDSLDVNEDNVSEVRASVYDLFGQLLEKIDPERAKILANTQISAKDLEDQLDYLKNKFVVDMVKRTELALTDENRNKMQKIKSTILAKAVTPAAAMQCVNNIGRAMYDRLKKDAEAMEKVELDKEIETKRQENQRSAARKKEIKLAENKRRQKNVKSK